LASVLPLAPPQAVNPRDRTAATAAYFAIERRFITTSFGFQGWREHPADCKCIFTSALEAIIEK
jgi:hypothetical protein